MGEVDFPNITAEMKAGQTQRSQVIWYELGEDQGTKSAVERSSWGCLRRWFYSVKISLVLASGNWGAFPKSYNRNEWCPQPLWDPAWAQKMGLPGDGWAATESQSSLGLLSVSSVRGPLQPVDKTYFCNPFGQKDGHFWNGCRDWRFDLCNSSVEKEFSHFIIGNHWSSRIC